MGENKNSAVLGLLGMFVCIVAFWGLKAVFPMLANLLLIGAITVAILLLILVITVMIAAFRKPKKEAGAQILEEIISIQKQGKSSLIDLRRIGMKIKNKEIQKKIEEICAIAEQILEELKNHKNGLSQIRQFFSYYLPTLGKVLRNYEKLESISAADETMTERMMICLAEIKSAMEKQYKNLFEKCVLDMTAEMEALLQACQRDGLFLEEDQDKITLIL